MRILLTNDDGIHSPVLYRVADALAKEHDVVVVAPSTDQSGKSHGFTHRPDKLLQYLEEKQKPYPAYQVDGTPCDCIKFAVSFLLREQQPDLVISGINLGENAGVSAVYSGTVAAAREAALWGIPAIAISLMGETDPHVEFALEWMMNLLRKRDSLPVPHTLWNVNFPNCEPSEVTGTEFTSMSTVMFTDHYVEVRTDHGITGYRLLGRKPAPLFVPGTDDYALRHKSIAITPLRIAQTDEQELIRLRSLPVRADGRPPQHVTA